jgi:hypothetical protein
MFISKKHLSRRTLLKGAGVTLALPLLDSMIPAQTQISKTAGKPVRRMGFVYVAHGMIMQQFTPVKEGQGFEMTRLLKPLEPFKDRLNIVTGLDNKNGVLAGAGHPGAASTWISAAKPKKTEGEDVYVGPTIDQIAAKQIGQETSFPSLELATEDASGTVGACDVGFSCTYVNTISWRTASTPNPMEINPRIVFDRLVGEGGTREGRAAKRAEDRSILDSIAQEMSHLKGELGAGDRAALNDYVENIREIERRIQQAEKKNEMSVEMSSPVGVPDNYEEHIKLMFDLQVLAYQADLTRISTFVLARELNQRAYPMLGVSDSHHSLSHHQNDPERIEKLAKIQSYHMGLFAYYLNKLKSTRDGEGTLLDNSLIMYGSGMSNSNEHSKFGLPVVLMGGAAGRVQGWRHIKNPEGTPMANLLVTMLDKMDVHIDHLEDSNGVISAL